MVLTSSMLATAVWCSLVCLLAGSLSRCAARHVHARPLHTECDNTVAGRHYLADSEGFVCTRSEFDYTNGCCRGGERYSCETCHEKDRCCSSYEHCVSCCLGPSNTAAAALGAQFRIHGREATGHWGTEFEFCAGKCRTHMDSTMHENSFIDDRHFCFSDSGRPKTLEHPPPVPAGVTVLPAAKGADCATACTERGLVCDAVALRALNHCDALREAFPCEAGCAVSGVRAEAPAYVVYGSAKPLFPTMCFVAESEERITCGTQQLYLRRLCACVPGT